ncbi:hypothetical protein BO99DRAFT_63118 [Aspergillus violaceofuscus CBS 115571]|uniref:Uncharacterized protein n=1 Tax=Aspergillus violaceofuscus (strain CBS 115571) TaxID=1450538 RepID=A0A2V5HDL5_ASPV1|nr:hypothetical protein BO99DRAFT_63118 [Aspergillus violaceofuscus CBS 115571]
MTIYDKNTYTSRIHTHTHAFRQSELTKNHFARKKRKRSTDTQRREKEESTRNTATSQQSSRKDISRMNGKTGKKIQFIAWEPFPRVRNASFMIQSSILAFGFFFVFFGFSIELFSV